MLVFEVVGQAQGAEEVERVQVVVLASRQGRVLAGAPRSVMLAWEGKHPQVAADVLGTGIPLS